MLFTKCILADPKPDDGFRISVMSRHTLDDGKTPDPRIKDFHFHFSNFGPSPKLIGSYKRKEIRWEEFEKRYLAEIQKEEPFIEILAITALLIDVTIMCIEESPEKCHRRLLADECKKFAPNLKIEHR